MNAKVNHEAAKKVETMLRDYYRKLNEIQHKYNLLTVVDQNSEEIKLMLLYVYDLIPSRGAVSRYRAISGDYYVNDQTAQRYFEFTSTIDECKEYLLELVQRQHKLKIQIMYLEAAVERITSAISQLDETDQVICEKCYGLRSISNIQIGAELNMNEKAIRYRRKRIASQLAKFPGCIIF